jgi:hypothetical protein
LLAFGLCFSKRRWPGAPFKVFVSSKTYSTFPSVNVETFGGLVFSKIFLNYASVNIEPLTFWGLHFFQNILSFASVNTEPLFFWVLYFFQNVLSFTSTNVEPLVFFGGFVSSETLIEPMGGQCTQPTHDSNWLAFSLSNANITLLDILTLMHS